MRVQHQSGFTLVEIVLAIGLLSVVLGGAAMVSQTGADAQRSMTAVAALEQNLQRSLQRAAAELTTSGVGLLQPDPVEGLAYDDLDFQQIIGQTDGVADPGPTQQLVTELEPGEFDDGLDNDGDGLVDERRLLLIRDPGGDDEQRVVLCSGVLELLDGELANGLDDNGNEVEDEPGFHLERNGSVLTLRMSLGVRGMGGDVLVRTSQLDVRLRN